MKPERPTSNPKYWGLYNKHILLTGGSGTFGHAFADSAVSCIPKTVRILSRDEFKQAQMRERYAGPAGPRRNFRWIVGDVRDREALSTAMRAVDIVIHAAALKRVDVAEYNPAEAVQTNVNGSLAIVRQAVQSGVPKVLGISSDKAVQPANLYGATKMVMERMFVQGNVLGRHRSTIFSCLRYGNVSGSRGSVLGTWQAQARDHGRITLRDPEATRFWITPKRVIEFAAECVTAMTGGEIFVPRAPSVSLGRMAITFADLAGCGIDRTSPQPGEKQHEQLISPLESVWRWGDRYVLYSQHEFWTSDKLPDLQPEPEGFEYRSDANDWWLTDDELQDLVAPYAQP